MKTSDKIITVEIFISYVIPLITFYLFNGIEYGYFVNKQPIFLTLVYIVFTSFAYFLIRNIRFIKYLVSIVAVNIILRLGRLVSNPQRALLVFSVLYLAFAVLFFVSGYNRFRYQESAAGSRFDLILLGLFLLKSVGFGIFFCIPLLGKSFVSHSRVPLSIIFLGNLLSIDGTMAVLIALLSFVLIFWDFYSVSRYNKNVLFKLLLTLSIPIFVPFLWMLGESVKAGDITIFYDFIDKRTIIFERIGWLIERLSTLYFSLNNVLILIESGDEWMFIKDAYEVVEEANKYRLCTIFGGECESITYAQISHYNYFLITEYSPLNSAGASPGIMASGAYFFGMFGFVASAIFFALFGAFIDTIQSYRRRPLKINLLGVITVLVFARGIMLNPADLWVLGTGLIYLVGFSLGCFLMLLVAQSLERNYDWNN